MNIDTKKNTITIDDVTYHVEREDDRGGHYNTTLSLTVFDMEQDEFVPVFEGLEGTIGYDDEPSSPREWSNVGTMAVSYDGYNLGDDDISKIDFEVECDGGYITLNPAEYFIRNEGARVVIGLFVFEHGGITMSAGSRVGQKLKKSDIRSNGRFMGDDAGWDTSFVGFIYDTPEGVKQCFGEDVTDKEIEAALRSEVEVYASYLEGDVSYYSVQDDETDFHDSCFGFIGNDSGVEEECFGALANAIGERLAENKERAAMAARDIITTD